MASTSAAAPPERATAASTSVDLTQLEVIRRYSLAVRQGAADRAELVAALRADLDWLEGARGAPVRSGARTTTSAKAGPRPARRG